MSFRYLCIFAVCLIFWTPSLFAAGEVREGKVSAYLQSAYTSVSSVEEKLQTVGFEIVGKDTITPQITTILFTCPSLKQIANKPKRGFSAVLRACVNQKDNIISITNPLYFTKAFLQKTYDEMTAHKILQKINTAFPNLTDAKDAMNYHKLENYHFTFGMPYYEDMNKVAKGAHDALLAKIKSKNPIFVLPLDKDRTLVGFKLTDETAKFVKKIGTKNAAVLPYTILIEGDKAYILAPKYYLALSYPQLKMTQFMTIANVPGKIKKECKAAFK